MLPNLATVGVVVSAVLVLAGSVRQLVEAIKVVVPYSKLVGPVLWLSFNGMAVQWQQLIDVSLVFGLSWAGCALTSLNLVSAFGLSLPFWLGTGLTAIVATLPASLVNTLVTWLEGLSSNK